MGERWGNPQFYQEKKEKGKKPPCKRPLGKNVLTGGPQRQTESTRKEKEKWSEASCKVTEGEGRGKRGDNSGGGGGGKLFVGGRSRFCASSLKKGLEPRLLMRGKEPRPNRAGSRRKGECLLPGNGKKEASASIGNSYSLLGGKGGKVQPGKEGGPRSRCSS